MELERETIAAVRAAAQPIEGTAGRWSGLLERMRDARFVLIGEATHGTHEFYRIRAQLTQALIRDHGFHAVAIEADWPDALRVLRYVRNESGDATADEALGGFSRFPGWMWRNTDVRAFVEWLATLNASRDLPPVGFYGLDLYSLHASADAVLKFLDEVDPGAAALARERYGCFEPYRHDVHEYGRAASLRMLESCEAGAVRQLVELLAQRTDYARKEGGPDAFFEAEQNARLVIDAEEYYRRMYWGGTSSWNLRDTHMANSLDALARHLDASFGKSRIVVWAHNSHLGDARATAMAGEGELNLGQLVRERHPGESFHLGFTTHHGTVIAAHGWDEPGLRRKVVPAIEGSVEALFHGVRLPHFWLPLGDGEATAALKEELLERAIGVVYKPETERWSHYFDARVAEQFDAVIHVDESHGVRPLEAVEPPSHLEPPETFPTSL